MNFQLSFVVVLTLATVTFELAGCRRGNPQDPTAIFTDRKDLPKELNVIANPQLDSAQLNLLKQKNPQGRVSVAVIDDGVDYRQPQIFQQIKFNIHGDQVVGAGLDILGGDFWPHPTTIDPSLFALTAKAIVDGKLQGVAQDPLQWINEVQNLFWQKLSGSLAADPLLADSLFRDKLRLESIVVFGVPEMLNNFELSRDTYVKKKENGLLLNKSNRNQAKILENYEKEELKTIYDDLWLADSDDGYPKMDSNILFSGIENSDRFFALIKQVFEQIDQEFQVVQAMKRHTAYINVMDDQGYVERTGLLNKAWFNHRFPHNTSSFLSMIDTVCDNMSTSARHQLQDPSTSGSHRSSIFRAEYKRQLEVASELYNKFTEQNQIGSSDLDKIKDFLSNTPKIAGQLDELFNRHPNLEKYLDCRPQLTTAAEPDPELLDFEMQRNHPYMEESSENYHGTHVSGIIARQNPKIDIVPIRVLTDTPAYVPELFKRKRGDLEKGFSEWSLNSDVAKAIKNESKLTLGHELSGAELQNKMQAHLNRYFRDIYSEYYFFEQIQKAIAYVGENKIKIANMSLGVKLTKEVVTPTSYGDRLRLRNFMDFLIYEYYKHSVATSIEQHAKNTLFVIAAGNDGKWLDGKVRSGLPCDLSSPILAQVQHGKPASAQVVNNRLKNILCVGSIRDQNDLSEYTNITFSDDVPFVLFHGESVLSTISQLTCKGARQAVYDQYGEIEKVPKLSLAKDDDRYDDLLKSAGWWPDGNSGSILKQRTKAFAKMHNFTTTSPSKIDLALVQSRCMKDRPSLARATGTSMSSPAVAGFIANSLINEANKRGLSADVVYSMAEFSPERLIQKIRQKSPVFGGRLRIKDVSKVIDVKTWEPGKADRVIGVIDFAK